MYKLFFFFVGAVGTLGVLANRAPQYEHQLIAAVEKGAEHISVGPGFDQTLDSQVLTNDTTTRLPPNEAIESGLTVQQPAQTALPESETALDTELTWEPVWAPFRSRFSAEGFANRLSLQTGIETTVTKEGAGAFQVRARQGGTIDDAERRLDILRAAGLPIANPPGGE